MDHSCAKDSWTHTLNVFIVLFGNQDMAWPSPANWSLINSTNHCLLKLGNILEWKSSQAPQNASIFH